MPVAETQAGKGALPWDHPLQLGAIGVTGSPAANALAAEADVVLAVGTRLSDFTTGSHSLFAQARLVNLNVNAFDARKWRGVELIADAGSGLAALSEVLPAWRADAAWQDRARQAADAWRGDIARLTGQRDVALPYDGDVIGAVQRSAPDSTTRDIVVCAAGTLPAELHKLWRTAVPGGYHMEYGYSCMGYEIAGGLGVKMARPEREVIVMVGDGSYLMLNAEIATSIMLGKKLVIVVLDNRGYGCINRLQQAVGGEPFNNLFDDCVQGPLGAPRIDFAAHAASMGALAENVKTIPELEAALGRARAADRTYVVCIETDPAHTTDEGGWWWEVAVPEVSERARGARGARRVRTGQTEAGAMSSDKTFPGRAITGARSAQRRAEPPFRGARDEPPLRREDRHQPDLVEQRRPAVARRRDAARNGAVRGPHDRLPGLRTRQQVSARVERAAPRARRARSRARVGLVLGPARARHRGGRDRRGRAAPEAPGRQRRQGDGVRRSGRQHPGRAAAAVQAAALRPRRAVGRLRRSPHALRAAHAGARRAASPTTITWARTSKRRPTSTG